MAIAIEESNMEIWKPILGYKGLYEASNLGNFRRLQRGKKLTPEKVLLAKRLLSEGRTLVGVAKIIGVSYGTTWMIRKGVTWGGDPKQRPVNTVLGSDFYRYLFMCQAGMKSRKSAHRLVWEAFNGPIPYPLQINHKNGVRDDNRLENLELVTASGNIQHMLKRFTALGKKHNEGGNYPKRKKSVNH